MEEDALDASKIGLRGYPCSCWDREHEATGSQA
jgi:hypothetical protein